MSRFQGIGCRYPVKHWTAPSSIDAIPIGQHPLQANQVTSFTMCNSQLHRMHAHGGELLPGMNTCRANAAFEGTQFTCRESLPKN